ncbi:TPA: PAAR domain-containing protein [Citrobacter freundii]
MARGNYLVRWDKTTCGGVIVTGCEDHTLFGKAVACERDQVTCGQHPGIYYIAGGIPFDTVHGRRMAGTSYSFSTCPCRARFIPSMLHDTYNFGTTDVSASTTPSSPEPEQHAQTAHRHHATQPASQQTEALPATCACDRDITMAEFRLIATRAPSDRIQEYLDAINLWLPFSGITTCRGKAHFLAQVCDETGAFSLMSEINGRSQHGDWYGRGFLQLTGQENYEAYDRATPDDILGDLEQLTRSPHDILSATWYYCDHLPCKSNADKDDFNMVCARINGGFIGYDSRLKYFNSFVKTLKAQHLVSMEVDGEFLFENSSIYDNKVYSLAWGLWHDPSRNLSGVAKSSSEALKGYNRAKELWGPDSSRINMSRRRIYGIHYDQIESFINGRLSELS